ncbi:hypothetical protein [Acidovorax sp. CF316]|uniref:hypothetical protein n=1 Tax=Acidovorax sp. CF316 TaxID=1144317 RepID=UPI0011B22736|nr:hypothetical protein [Acidovorax sp. CF316]
MHEDAINPVTLLIHLERPHAEYSGIATLEQVTLAGLTSSSSYWVDLALKWLERGALSSDAIARQLQATAETLHRSHQSLRHRCASLARKQRQVAN